MKPKLEAQTFRFTAKNSLKCFREIKSSKFCTKVNTERKMDVSKFEQKVHRFY